MNNGELTKAFLSKIDKKAKSSILEHIANHYRISELEAFEEVTDHEAEYLLDYMAGNHRLATSVLMQKHGFR